MALNVGYGNQDLKRASTWDVVKSIKKDMLDAFHALEIYLYAAD